MRLVIILSIILVASQLNAQTPKISHKMGRNIILVADSITIQQGFKHLDRMCSQTPIWYYNRFVIKNDTLYMKFGIGFKNVYRKDGKKLVRVKEYEL